MDEGEGEGEGYDVITFLTDNISTKKYSKDAGLTRYTYRFWDR